MHDKHLTKEDLLTIINKARNKYSIPATAVAIINSETIPLLEIQGVRVVDKPERATLEDFFHIGSCSKSVMAVMAGRLVDAGKLEWQTKFFDVFPELLGEANNDFSGINLEDLFKGEAGILKYDSAEEKFPDIDPRAKNKRLEFVKYLIKQAPASKRKANGKYKSIHSNASYTMIAAMLENVTGKTYEELIRQTLVNELGLKVHIGWPNNFDSGQPWGHIINGREIESYPPEHEYKLPELIAPAGNLSMNPIDFAKFIQLQLQGLKGQSDYLERNSFEYIHFGHIGLSIGFFNSKLAGHPFSATNGSAGTFYCQAIIIPDSDFAFTMMMNAGSGGFQMRAVNWLTSKIIKQHFNWWWKFWL